MQAARRPNSVPVRFSVIAATVAAAVLLIVFHTWFSQVFSSVARPAASVGRWLSTHVQAPANIRSMQRERDQLRAELRQVSQQLAISQKKLEDSQTLANLDKFVNQAHLDAIVAAVIAYSPDPGVQSVVIQQGTDRGVAPGLAVITNDGILIGVVVRATTATATVRLLFDSQSKVLAKIQNEAQSRGLILGQRGLAIKLELIPRNDKVEAGQTVVTSGLDPKIPPDLLIGTVRSTTAEAGGLFQTADVSSPIEFNRLTAVAVVKARL